MNLRKSSCAIIALTLFGALTSIEFSANADKSRSKGEEFVQVHFRFKGPKTYGNNQPYKGGDIFINGFVSNIMPWGTICDSSMDTDPSPTALNCTVKLPKGVTLIGQVIMIVPKAKDGMVFFGDMSYDKKGGHGVTLGDLNVDIKSAPAELALVPAPDHNDPNPVQHGEPKEKLTYNFMIQL